MESFTFTIKQPATGWVNNFDPAYQDLLQPIADLLAKLDNNVNNVSYLSVADAMYKQNIDNFQKHSRTTAFWRPLVGDATLNSQRVKLLIHADSAARSGFVASWLTGKMTAVFQDAGQGLRPDFVKVHFLEDVLKFFDGVRIRVRPTKDSIDLLSFLFLEKVVFKLSPEKRKYSEYELFEIVNGFAQEIFNEDRILSYRHYDHVINFADTFDTNKMIALYQMITNTQPNEFEIKNLKLNSAVNTFSIDKNHPCSLLKLMLTREELLGLSEKNRLWSINDIFNLPHSQRYDAVIQTTNPKNYLEEQ